MKFDLQFRGPIRRAVMGMTMIGLALSVGCFIFPIKRFTVHWEGDPAETALVYGHMLADEEAPALVSIYKMLQPMLGAKGLGDSGVYEDGSFAITDLGPGKNYFWAGFWSGKDMYNVPKSLHKTFSLKAGEIYYVGTWEMTDLKRHFVTGITSFKSEKKSRPKQSEILAGFLKDPACVESGWDKKIKAEIARLKKAGG